MNKDLVAQVKWLEKSLNVYKRAFDVAIEHNREEKANEYKEEINKLELEIKKIKSLFDNCNSNKRYHL